MSHISLTDIRKSKSFQIFQTLLCFGILAAVLTFCFSLLKYSFYPIDEPYQIMNSMDYKNSPLAPLTAILDHFTNSLCGYDYLKMKYVAFGYNVLAVFAGCLYFYTHTKKLDITVLICSTLILICNIVDLYTWIGWDRQTSLFLTMTLVSFLYYLEEKKLWLLVITAIFSFITSLSRIPSIAIIPIISFFIIFQKDLPRTKRFFHFAIYGVISIICILLFIIISYNSLGNYLQSISNNIIHNHDINHLIYHYYIQFINICITMSLILSVYVCISRFNKNKYLIVLFSIFAVYIITYYAKAQQYFLFPTETFIIPSIFIFFCFIIYHYNKKTDYNTLYYFFFIFLCSIVPILGSNMGIRKFLALPLTPILIYFAIPFIRKPFIITSIIIISSTLLLFEYQPKFPQHYFHSEVIKNQTYKFTFSPLNGVYVNPYWGEKVSEIVSDIDKLNTKNSEVIVLGTYIDRFLFEWIYDCRNDYLKHDYKNSYKFDDDNYVLFASNLIHKKCENITVIYLFNQYTWECNKPYESKMSQMLESQMDLAVKKDKYAIFISKESE